MSNEINTLLNTTFKLDVKRLLILGLMVTAVGCGKDGESAKSGQSIVRINDDEITVHQVNSELQKANIKPEQMEAAEKQIVRSLIDRQILVQAALNEKLDRNPQVMSAIESNKMQILSQAYLEGKVAKMVKPTEAEILDYREKNPDVFENRKIYAMEEIAFVIDKSNIGELEQLSNTAKTLDEVIQWLDSHQIKFAKTKAVHAAEALPSQLLSKFSKMANGELIFINAPSRIVVGQLIETKSQPISLNDSKPLIERLLTNQKRKKAAEDELLRLRQAAKIVYLDKKYEGSLSATGTIKPNAAKPSETSNQEAKPSENSTASSDSKNTTTAGEGKKVDSHIEKGLSGL
jgi:peptidyl-prolyl cis-trans isomerase C